ncbi:putative glycolipid-binding domain-containing protein [Pedobacter sp. PAMC26386]|nr:putative glycolipid-binding domain-containing protein [Pedobacter sp. PAMC26386]
MEHLQPELKQINLIWEGHQYNSTENCVVSIYEKGAEIESVIVGSSGEKPFRLDYTIRTNERWETIFFDIKSQFDNKKVELSFESDGKGNWTDHGKPLEGFKGCIDIDISLTPFTNTLPIRRLGTKLKTEQEIKVIYFDILNQVVRPNLQEYIGLTDFCYQYRNIDNGYEALLTVDELGLVVVYPTQFTRSTHVTSDY